MALQPVIAVEVFWCRGAGIDRCAAWDRPERTKDLPARDCPKYRRHPSHSWTFIAPSVAGKGQS